MTMVLRRSVDQELRPPRLNFAGFCVYCLERSCERAGCIEKHARLVWQVCPDCGGTEWVRGHIDPDTATERCFCIGGVCEVAPAEAVA
ncbi:hypothetical protein [Nocardia gamkensis]|uniref:Uncharacterized protein n=1 Tax=Nocardia gamkensis TaxID=352869 RepID=A0A7X6R5H0_9NOCA|nr:hypothetical protein [Nocardia gamkensis]NKY29544.1 hypothetical protein [Nocardia gamkensis]NQE72459.1 hypothetical protein [Nocardia gamkensis]